MFKEKHPFLKPLAELPFWYSFLLVTCTMYYYSSSYFLLFALAFLPIQIILFHVFDFMKEHNFLGGLLYGAIGILDLILATGLIYYAEYIQEYPVFFYVWFLTPQGILDFCLPYVIAIFLLFSVFFSSVCYYFTLLRYRYFMTFLVASIPFTLFSKEGSDIPVFFVVSILLLYFGCMIEAKSLRNAEPRYYKQSTCICLCFLGLTSGLIMAIPKPEVGANREYIERVLQASSLSDFLMSAIQQFTDSSDGGSYYTGSGILQNLYTVTSTEADLRLKIRIFSSYSFAEDAWKISDLDNSSNNVDINGKTDLLTLYQGIDDFLKENPEYQKTNAIEAIEALPEQESYLGIYFAEELRGNHTFFLVPAQTKEIKIYDSEGNESIFGIYKVDNGSYMHPNLSAPQEYSVGYYKQDLYQDPSVQAFCRSLDLEKWGDLLETMTDASVDGAWEALQQFHMAESYLTMEEIPESICNLAQELTMNAESDWDKAKAIEQYFGTDLFLYDLDFQKQRGSNSETFLFETHTGVCYDYATAMVLLCRSVGIPARYCEGYALYEEESYNGSVYTYKVNTEMAHAFPEVYLAGYGWYSFEPTIANQAQRSTFSFSKKIQYVGISMMGIVILSLLFYVFLYPLCCEAYFRKKVKKSDAGTAYRLLIQRMIQQMNISNTMTLKEALTEFQKLDGTYDAFFLIAEQMYYGERTPDETEKEQGIDCYLKFREALKKYKKENKQGES